MIRLIAHLLQKTGYVTVFMGLAYLVSCSVDPGGCKRDPLGPAHLMAPFAILVLVLGYGACLRRQLDAGALPWLWLASTVIYLGTSASSNFYTIHWEGVVNTFTPQFRPGDLLETIGSLYQSVTRYWMPVAGALSAVAAIGSFIRKTPERTTPANLRPHPEPASAGTR